MFGLKKTELTREHASSYYAATANWQTDYPALEDDISADGRLLFGGPRSQ